MSININITINPAAGSRETNGADNAAGLDEQGNALQKSQRDLRNALNYMLDAIEQAQQQAAQQIGAQPQPQGPGFGQQVGGADNAGHPQGPLMMLMTLMLLLQKLMQQMQHGAAQGEGDGHSDLWHLGDQLSQLGERMHQQDQRIADRLGFRLN
jgi:hypothetical protein